MSVPAAAMAIELQHVNVKLILANGDVDLALLVPVFNIWIQDQVFGGLLLDIADYRHVPAGPGVVLIGHDANYSVDNTGGRLGVRYNRKAPLEGSNQNRLTDAAREALKACQKLEAEPRLGGKVRFGGREIELFVNDRLLAPNNEATREAAKPELESFTRKLLGGGKYTFSYPSDPRQLFGVAIKTAETFTAAQLLANLG